MPIDNIKPEFMELLHAETERSKREVTIVPERLFYFFGTVRQLKITLNV